ncbi:MAG: NAD(P)/FAD-dependent oxidoreductase [Chloroflexota bacterium]|nr:NAD(P)/FAD-dependent oxidoreductase [Chloroflexota bacterium]
MRKLRDQQRRRDYPTDFTVTSRRKHVAVTDYDVAIVGAGPAGLSAALMLGRCRRRVVVIDNGAPRNRVARATHGFLSRDGIAPSEFLRLGHAELAGYPTVELRAGTVLTAEGSRGAFIVCCADGYECTARRLLLATGVVDELPQIAGLAVFYGHTVHHCPFCDAYEYADRPLAQYGRGRSGVDAALVLRAWSDDVILVTDGKALGRRERTRCERHGVAFREEPIRRFVGRGRKLARIVFTSGPDLPRDALFFATSQEQRSALAKSLGCDFNAAGSVATQEHEMTNVPGVYVVGDASRREQKLVIAAAEGAEAAIKIHESLWREDLRRPTRSRASAGTQITKTTGSM